MPTHEFAYSTYLRVQEEDVCCSAHDHDPDEKQTLDPERELELLVWRWICGRASERAAEDRQEVSVKYVYH